MQLGHNAKFNPRSRGEKPNQDEWASPAKKAIRESRKSAQQYDTEASSTAGVKWRSDCPSESRKTRVGVWNPRESSMVGTACLETPRGPNKGFVGPEALALTNTVLQSDPTITRKDRILRYQKFFKLAKSVKGLYKNKKKESAPWQHRYKSEQSSSGSDTYYTALESQHSRDAGSPGGKSSSDKRRQVEFAPGEKLQVDDLDHPTQRTPFMMLLLLAIEILMFCTFIFLIRWLVNYRGGVKWLEAFVPGNKREPKHAVNLHAASMFFCFAFCMPQVTVARIFFEKFSEKTKNNIELGIRALGFTGFVVGMQQIYSIDSRYLPESLDGPDKGIHLILSGAAIAVYLISTLNFILNALTFYYEGIKDAIVLGYVINLFLNSHVVETLGHLNDLLAFLSILTGFLAYIIILFSASYYDLRHVFNNPISADSGENLKEEDAYLVVLILLTFMYLTNVCIVFYQHNILFHNGIITYQMYKNNFKEIADALARAKNQQEAIQEMTDIECLCQYDNPQMTRVSQGGRESPKNRMSRTRGSAAVNPKQVPESAKVAQRPSSK